ncbi:MAG: helicase C-terminal domain-containing protein [Spirochaetales bacterium]
MQAEQRFTTETVWSMRAAIDESSGGEVAFVCNLDDEGKVASAKVVARGVEDVVAAPMLHFERGMVVVHNHPSGNLQPSRPDVSVAAELADSGIGFFIVNNDVTEVLVVCEPVEPVEKQLLDPDELAALLDAGGPLAQLFDEFEPRESQIEMLKRVAEAFNEDDVLAVEAGTGVGKSYAYLIPALAWAAANEERVVVTTATINLQQQLVNKDIPMVQRILGSEVPVELVKGRGNYLCRKRLGELADEQSLFSQNDLSGEDMFDSASRELDASIPGTDDEQLSALREWADTTDTGSRSELPFVVPDELWSQINSDADSCSEVNCRLRENCFFQKSRRRAAAARVLIVNHHLLFVDLALRVRGIGFENRAVLPPFQRLIFDEAHIIENSATSLFSESFSLFSVRKHTRRLLHRRGSRTGGLLPRVRQRGAAADRVVAATKLVAEVEEAAVAVNAAAAGSIAEFTFRFTVATEQSMRRKLLEPVGELHTRLIGLSHSLVDLLEDDDEEEGGPFHDLRVVARRIERIITLCESFTDYENHSDRVFWIELRRAADGSRFARFISSQLDIRSVMREAVYDAFDTAVFTSATLTVADSFDYWGGRIGLLDAPRSVSFATFPSPFPYSECALLGVPTDAPLPSTPEYSDYLHGFLSRLLEISEGKALILFTSYQMLREAYDALRPRLGELGIAALRQGEDDRARLLARFTEDTTSVLFATESFWQGVDAPGETLQLVVLCRLPFRVPTDPVLMARTEAIEAKGGNAFAELSLPEAVMKFRQGFGRLVRRQSDRGVVIITDVRVVTKQYGRLFLGSLPETQMSQAPSDQILEDVERFLY